MSGYRSLKRVLGETSLERKCRILFGVAIFVLVSVAFWGVLRVAENLVKNETRRRGRDAVDLLLIGLHWQAWTTDNKVPKNEEFKELQEALLRDLVPQDLSYTIVALDSKVQWKLSKQIEAPADETEDQILKRLKTRLDEEIRSGKYSPNQSPEAAAEPTTGLASADAFRPAAARIEPIFEERARPDLHVYEYYEPVYWRGSCNYCHGHLEGRYAMSAAEAPDLTQQTEAPFRVVKVTMPFGATQSAINSLRAILVSVGIALGFMSMIALYVIVRYVILKPLTHLRDVSDSIGRGNTQLRADIHTGDEFEDLAASFNKMLHGLTEQELQLRTVNEELDGKVDQLAQLNMRLYEMNRVKSDFLANMSHELRTPLNSIIGFSEVLQGIDSLSDKQKRYALNIQKSGRLLLEMINDILDLAKMEAGRMEVRPTEFRIDAIVSAQCDMVRKLTEDKNIDLVTNIAPDLPLLYQDQSKVQQILMNLLSNAIKFTPDGGRIVVTASPNERGMFELSVSDTGVGIAESDREIIFEKFRQGTIVHNGDGLTREYSGTGLGLSIVKELCKLLGGEITFDSELGRGSTFRIQLPFAVTQLPRPESPLTARIDDLTKPRRADYERRETAPAT